MADRTKAAKSAVYPNLSHASTARRQIDAADDARLHVLGPWTGGDGSAARRPLRQPQGPPLPSPRSNLTCSATAAASPSTAMKMVARGACAMKPTLAGVLRVDRRWAPTARTRRAMPAMMCTHCVDCHESRQSAR